MPGVPAQLIRLTVLVSLFRTSCTSALHITVAGVELDSDAGQSWASFDDHLDAIASAAKVGNWSIAISAYSTPDMSTNKSLSDLLVGVDTTTAGRLANSYFNEGFAENFVLNALQGTGPFSNWDASSRSELATKGVAYQIIRLAMLARLDQAISVCSMGNRGGGGAAESAAEHWEVAWALFAGSREGEDGSGKGNSLYALGDKRCPQFDTCEAGSVKARSNARVKLWWENGLRAIKKGECFDALTARSHIDSYASLPILQGLLREAWEADPHGGNAVADGLVEVAEGWAFTAAVLPQIAQCDTKVGVRIKDNMYLNQQNHVKDGFRIVKAELESIYSCLGVKCDEMGGMLDGDGDAIPGMEPCTEENHNGEGDEDDEDGEDALRISVVALSVALVISLVLVLLLAVAIVMLLRQKQPVFVKNVETPVSSIAPQGQKDDRL